MNKRRKKIGVLALQGAFAAHAKVLGELGHQALEVRSARDLDEASGLVLPGGESTTQLRLIEALGLEEPLARFFARADRPVLATCAGLILLAREVLEPEQKSFGVLDVSVVRNGWGRQLDSFEAVADGDDLPLMFIRAPRIREVGTGVEVLARFGGEPVLVKQGTITAATFHPELTRHRRVHRDVFGHGFRRTDVEESERWVVGISP